MKFNVSKCATEFDRVSVRALNVLRHGFKFATIAQRDLCK